MTILYHKPFSKSDHQSRGRGVKNTQKFDHVVYGWPLSVADLLAMITSSREPIATYFLWSLHRNSILSKKLTVCDNGISTINYTEVRWIVW